MNLLRIAIFLTVIPLHVSSLKCSSSGGYSYTHAAYGTVTVSGGLSVHSLSENSGCVRTGHHKLS